LLRSLPLTVALVLTLAAGCRSGPKIAIEQGEVFQKMPPGKTAVLEVTARLAVQVRGHKYVWGAAQPPSAEAMFAELLASFAQTDGGLDVIPPHEVKSRLQAAGLQPTLEPGKEQMDQFARTLGCSTYLSAQIERWGLHYFLWTEKAVAEFVVRCYVPGEAEPLWTVRVQHEAKLKSCREVAIEALREAFRQLARKGNP
jgi:hypothetical protein